MELKVLLILSDFHVG
jgi:hypothetical protein